MPVISVADARRLFLAAQGLLDDPSRRVTAKTLNALIQQMGFVQIDTINVIERAHHLTLYSRLDHYRHDMLTTLLEETRDLFEHWTHDASAIPTQWFPHWQHRFERYRKRLHTNAWWKQRVGRNPKKLFDAVKKQIVREGPMLSRDFEPDARSKKERPEDGWWGWKPQKAALEHLWRIGELAVVKRINFQKVYDLTERVFPKHHSQPAPQWNEHVDWACRSALERLGVATPTELARFWYLLEIADARKWCAAAVERSEIVEVQVESEDGSPPRAAFAPVDWEDRARRVSALADERATSLSEGGAGGAVRLLCPFDPVLRDRSRTQRLFNFEYTFEAFTPAPKRTYGYFVMPLMQGERLIGRLDPKLHRDRGVLEIKGMWLEPKVKLTKMLRRAIDAEVQRLANFTVASTITWPRNFR